MLTAIAVLIIVLLFAVGSVALYRAYRTRQEAACVQRRLEDWCG